MRFVSTACWVGNRWRRRTPAANLLHRSPGRASIVWSATRSNSRSASPRPSRSARSGQRCGSATEPLTSADSDGLTYHFFAFEPEKLKPDAPISLGWSSPSEGHKETPYRFTMPSAPRQ
jgi:hypothetical protein